MKKVLIHSKVRELIRTFPEEVRYKIGKAIFFLQQGENLQMPLSRPIPSVDVGVKGLRVKGHDGAYRVFYLVEGENRILVFHAFVKKTQKTPYLQIELAKKD